MLKRLLIPVLIAAASLMSGCLQKETTHTLYLAPDGAVAWVTSEANVHSNETEAGNRIAEEQAFIGPALLGTHGAARGLAALGPQGAVRTMVLRDERPFHVVTDARFAAVDRVLERLFTEMEIRTTASLVRGAGDTTLRVRLDFSHPIPEHETPISQLSDNIEHFRIVLTEGRFGAVTGFDVTDGTSVTLSTDWLDRAQQAYDAKGTIEFSLSWAVQ